jgi:hypothetical protein
MDDRPSNVDKIQGLKSRPTKTINEIVWLY